MGARGELNDVMSHGLTQVACSVTFVEKLRDSTDQRLYLNDFYRWLEYDKPVEERRFARCINQLPGLLEAGNLDEADLWILPMTWNYYVDHKRIGVVREIVDAGKESGKRVIAFSTGDFTANVPFAGLTIFEASVYRSRNNGAQAMPIFIEDYLEKFCQGNVMLRRKESKPVVGFCGQVAANVLTKIARATRLSVQRASWELGLRTWEPATVEHAALRSRVIDQLSASPLVQTNFILRRRYKGGDGAIRSGVNHSDQVKAEFVNNILQSDYTLCVRGTGNFSTRFYETLCLGRIPIFIDTDCRLPLDRVTNWKEYCVWVEQSEIPRIGEKIADFHSSLTEGEFRDLQGSSRQLWLEHLRRDDYYRHFRASFGLENKVSDKEIGKVA